MAIQYCEAELHMAGLGQGPPLVFMSSRMLSYLVEYLLADKFVKTLPQKDLTQGEPRAEQYCVGGQCGLFQSMGGVHRSGMQEGSIEQPRRDPEL